MKVSPVSFAYKSNLKTNNYSKNPISPISKQENDVFVLSKKAQNPSFTGLFKTNPILTSKHFTDDDLSNFISFLYQKMDEEIGGIEKQSKTDVKKLRSFIKLGQKQDFKGYVRVKNLTQDGRDGLLKFGDLDEYNLPSRIDISYPNDPLKAVQTYTFDDMCHITRTYIDDNGIKSITVSQGEKPWSAIQRYPIDNSYKEITFYPNGLRTVILGKGIENSEKDAEIFLTFDKKDSQRCHYFEVNEDDADKVEHYTFNTKTNKWELAEMLDASEAQEAFSNTISSLIPIK